MKVLIPVRSEAAINRFCNLGTNMEFYTGFEDPLWYETFGRYEDMNRMSAFYDHANASVSEFHRIAHAARVNGCVLYVTLNAGIYSLAQEKWLERSLAIMEENQVSGVILGDMTLAHAVKAHHLKAVASTMAGIYNAEIASFALKVGFDRVILPRDLTLQEANHIMTRVPELEYECFVMRNGCRYSDSHCLCRHNGKYGSLCSHLDKAQVSIYCEADTFADREETDFTHYLFAHALHKEACGLCALWRLINMGVSAGKVVGRADAEEKILDDVTLVLKNIDIASACDSEEEYLSKMILPMQQDVMCIKGTCCYYPEVRFGR